MGIRGRQSEAALTVVTPSPISSEKRQTPPQELTVEQANEWVLVVNRLPADWIQDEMRALLAAYCRHVVSQRHVADMVATLEASGDFDLDKYEQLLRMQDREGRAISSLATRLRLTPQSTYSEQRKKRPTATKKPW